MTPARLLSKYLIAGLAVVLLAVAVTATALFMVYHQALNDLSTASLKASDQALTARLEHHGADLGKALGARLVPSLSAGNDDEVGELLETARGLSGARLLMLKDRAGRSVQLSGDPTLAPETSDAAAGIRDGLLWTRTRLDTEQGQLELLQVFDVARMLNGNEALNEQLASIRVEADRRGLASMLGFGLLLLLAIASAIAVLAYRQIRRLQALAHSVGRLADGDYTAALPVKANDEFGQLVQAFDEMRERLRSTTVSRDYLDSVLASMVDAIILTDQQDRISRVNAAACKLLGYAESELLGKPVRDFVAPGQRAHFGVNERRERPSESVFVNQAGAELPVSYSWATITGPDAALSGAIISARNIAERKIAEQRIRYLARIDALTKVPNRMQFQHLLQRSIAKAQRRRERLALLYLDVDRFKDINDTFGHMAGDASLETLTARVGKLLPEGAFMGRLAGDEFGIVLRVDEPPGAAQAYLQSLARTILRSLNEVLIMQGHELYITASIGIAAFPQDADNVLDLIRNADAALYHAKRGGGNRLEFYNPEMNAAAVERLMLKSKLRRSYELDELLMNYQPKYSLHTGRMVGAEALVRWELTDHGIVLPSEFIPLAEETNLILEIGEWVLNRVCADYAKWQKVVTDPGRISVNLSLKQLAQQDFVRRIDRIMRRHSIAMDCLEFEITESTLMEDPEKTVRILRELAGMGLHLAIDDFGTGYSSLSALQQFPIETLKIDRSFVRDSATDPDDATLVSTIVDMGHSMKMNVVAEGVESEEQLAFLRTLNCDQVQGHLFGDAMTADEYLVRLLEQQSGSGSYRALLA